MFETMRGGLLLIFGRNPNYAPRSKDIYKKEYTGPPLGESTEVISSANGSPLGDPPPKVLPNCPYLRRLDSTLFMTCKY